MVAAFLCGALFGGLVVWERWVHAERVRRRCQLLETLPPSNDEMLFDFEQLASPPYEDGTDNGSTAWKLPRGMTIAQGFEACRAPACIQPDVELPFVPSHSGCCNGKD